MIKKMIQKRTIGEKKMCGRRGYLHPLLQAVTHSTREAMRPEKKDTKRKTGKSDQKEEDEILFLKANLWGVICQQNVSELLMRRNRLNDNLTQLSWKNTQMAILMFSFRKKNLIETPVPSNIQEVKKMDEFNLQLLKEKHQKTLLAQDLIYEKNPEEKSGCIRSTFSLWNR